MVCAGEFPRVEVIQGGRRGPGGRAGSAWVRTVDGAEAAVRNGGGRHGAGFTSVRSQVQVLSRPPLYYRREFGWSRLHWCAGGSCIFRALFIIGNLIFLVGR